MLISTSMVDVSLFALLRGRRNIENKISVNPPRLQYMKKDEGET